MPRNNDILLARQSAANCASAQAALDRATARVRELEALAATLNGRLAEANELAIVAEQRAEALSRIVFAAGELPHGVAILRADIRG